MENTLKITDLPQAERPRERLLKYGADTLSNSELLAIILRSGTAKENALCLSTRLLKSSGGLDGLLSFSAEDFMKLQGIGAAKAAELLALSEISKRFRTFKSGGEYKINQPKDAAELVMESMKCLRQEYLRVIMLNTKNVVINVKDVSMGTLNSSIVHPREVFSDAIRKNSASIIICHNHPSGDPNPSSEDISITHRLKESGKLLGIELLDHIIIGNGNYTSLKEKGIV